MQRRTFLCSVAAVAATAVIVLGLRSGSADAGWDAC